MFTGNPSTQHGPTSQRYLASMLQAVEAGENATRERRGHLLGWRSNGWCSNKSQKKMLTYLWFNIEAWNKVYAFSGKKVWKSVALRIGFLAILELVESFRLCLFDSGFLKSVQYFELTEYVDIFSKGVKGWKHQEPFLKLIWRDSGQVDLKFMFCEGGSTVQMLFELGVHQWPSIPVVSWREKEPPY